MKTHVSDMENEMSRRYLKIMQKWIPFGMQYFQDWPDRPNCGHFFGGVYWYGDETAWPLLVLASVISSPEYSSEITGFSRDHLLQTAIKAMRYLCFTHDTGPVECVRPESKTGHKHLQKTKWGERGKGFFQESQCGVTLAAIISSALLIHERLDTETRSMLENICADYLERFGTMPPRSGVYNDTQTEENAWTALGLTGALLFLGRHKRKKNWDEVSRRWMFCTSTVPDDMSNRFVFEKGKTVGELCGKVITTLPDFMAENHGVVHPGYTAAAITLSGMTATLHQLFGLEAPEHLYWHRKEIYDALKYLTEGNGRVHPIQGMDWPYLIPGAPMLHGHASLYLKDPDAAVLEDAALLLEEKMLEKNQGSMFHPDITKYCSNIQDPMIFWEPRIGQSYPWIYLAHRLNMSKEQQPKPATSDVLARKNPGVKMFPHSGFVFHRHDKGQTSFSWRNSVMALPLPRAGLLAIAPGMGTLLARVKVREYAESRKQISLQVNELGHGFTALMVHDVAQESVRQSVLFASLPDGNIVCTETLTALKDCTVEKLEQGHLQIMNENFPGVPSCKGFRKLYHSKGEQVFPSLVKGTPEEDVLVHLENSSWLNIDDQFGIVFSGDVRAVYHNKHYFKPYHAVADDLFLNLDENPKKYPAGGQIASLSFLFCPEQPHAETPKNVFGRAKTDAKGLVGFLTDGYLVTGNFGEQSGCFSLKFPRSEVVPVFASAATVIRKDQVDYQTALNARQGNYFSAVALIETNGEGIRADAAAAGGTCLTNEGNVPAEIKYCRKGIQERIMLEAGRTLRVSPIKI